MVRCLSEYDFSGTVFSFFLRCYIFFVIGMYCIPGIIRYIETWGKRKVFALSLFTVIFVNIAVYAVSPNSQNIIFKFFMGIIGSCCIITFSQLVKNKFLEVCGRYTLPIYVLQGYAITAVRIVITRLSLNDAFGINGIVLCTIFGMAVPLLAYYVSTKLWKLDFIFYPAKYLK